MSLPSSPPSHRLASRVAWIVFGVLFAILLVATATDQRRGWTAVLPGEATALMQAESLVHDRDLRYSRLDFDRHSVTRPALPPDLALATGSAGREITFDHPVLHAMTIAPFVAWQPIGGHSLGQALLLVLAASFAAWRLRPRVGFAGPMVVASLVFATSAFAHVFLATSGLWSFAAALLAAGLLIESGAADDPHSSRRGDRRWWFAGLCLALAVVAEPTSLALVAAAWMVAPTGRARVGRRLGLIFGLLAGLVGQAVLFWWAGGGLGVFGTERFRFRGETGFPLVDFPGHEWSEQLRVLSATVFDGAPRLAWGFDGALWGWNLLDLLIGRHGGLLIYALPVAILWLAGSRRGRRAWTVAAVLWVVSVLALHPFDLADGPTVGNLRALPLIAFSLIVFAGDSTRLHPRTSARTVAVASIVTVLVAALGLGGLWPWMSPSAERQPVTPGDGLVYPTTLARSVLPYESAQQTLPGGPVLDLGGLRLRPLSAHVEPSPGEALTMDGDRSVELWVSSLEPLDAVRLDFGEDAPSTLEVEGATLGDRLLTADGGIAFRLDLRSGRRHVLWWSPHRQSIYPIRFHFPNGADTRLRFRLVGERLSEEPTP